MKRINAFQWKIVMGFVLLSCVGSTPVFSQSAFTFLNAPPQARLAALGGVNISLADRDVNFFTNNPALAGDTLDGVAAASYQFYLAGIGQSMASYQHRFKKIGSLAFNVQHINYGTIHSYDASGADLGDFYARETALTTGKYFQSANFRFGANLKAVFSNLAGYNATALALDLGGLFMHPKKNVSIALAVKNLGFTLLDYSEGSSSALPFDVQLGCTFKPEHMPFRFSLTAFDLTAFDVPELNGTDASTTDMIVRHLNIGTELLLSKNVNVLAAYNFQKRQELKVAATGGGAGFSFGLCVNIKNIELVVSRSSYGPQQPAYGFTLAANTKTLLRKRTTI
jgi:hypothetical protein